MDNDLIERSALLDEIYGDNSPDIHDGLDLANWQMSCIYCAPAIDAEPVRHGRWNYSWMAGILHRRCTECGSYINDNWIDCLDFNYCPNCGARMDGDAESCASQN